MGNRETLDTRPTICLYSTYAPRSAGLTRQETPMERFTQRLGQTDETRNNRRGYVVVTVELRTETGPHQTTDHGIITDPLTLSVQASQYAPYDHRDDPSRCGQCLDALSEVTTPAPGWTAEEITELAGIWGRWHLNTLRAGCAHMPADAHARWEARETVVCEAGSGYCYGSAWLAEQLPEEIIDRVRYLMRDRSADLYAARGYDGSGRRTR